MRASPARAAAALAALAFFLCWSHEALAIGLMGEPTRVEDETHTDQPLIISRIDCEGSEAYEFIVTGLVANQELSVWGTSTGADCTIQEQRHGASAECVEVAAPVVVANTTHTRTIPASEIAKIITEGGCIAGGDTTGSPRGVTLYFLINESQGMVPADQAHRYEGLNVDLWGPAPPTVGGIAPHSDTTVSIKITEPTPLPADLARYVAFCSPAGTTTTTVTATTTGTGGTTTTTTAAATGGAGGAGIGGAGGLGVGGLGGSGGLAATGGMMGAGGMGGAATSTTATTSTSATSGAGGSGECSSDQLTPGEIPADLTLECGDATSPTETVEATVTPGVVNAFAVAAVDEVDNVGPLSALVCGEPEPVTDFFDAYREAGGLGGGGFCNCSLVGTRSTRPLAFALLVLGAAALVLRRRGTS